MALPRRIALNGSTKTLFIKLLLLLIFPALGSAQLSSSETECLGFLHRYMPEEDRQLLDPGFLQRNVHFAVKARELTAQGSSVLWSLLLNDVLPYAVLNEQRDDWRAFFFTRGYLDYIDQHAGAEHEKLNSRAAVAGNMVASH